MMRYGILILGFCFAGVVYALALPTANLVVTPSTGQVTKTFTFDASASRTSQGITSGLEYRFQFRDGGDWSTWSPRSKITFTPMDVGSFRARVQIRDRNTKATQTTYRSYRVMGDMAPRARIKVDNLRPQAGESVRFELIVAQARTQDPDKVQVRWDFDSDGIWETSFSRTRVAWQAFDLTEARQLSPTAEVIYADGTRETIRGIETQSGNVTRSYNWRGDWPKLTITPSAVVAPIVDVSPGSIGYTEETQFKFDASKSLIPRNGWLEWSFDGEQILRGRKTVSKTFPTPGKHEIRVRTCVNRRNPECAETSLIVEARENPVGFFVEVTAMNLSDTTQVIKSQEAYRATVGNRIRLNASVATQAGNIGTRQYRWDYEGDGKWDTAFSTSSAAEYTYPRVGQYRPTVQVQSEDSVLGTGYIQLEVTRNTAPKADFTITPPSIRAGDRVLFRPEVSDTESNRSRLEVRFDVQSDGTWESEFRALSSFTWRYSASGTYRITMQVRDEGKKSTTVTKEVVVQPSLTLQQKEQARKDPSSDGRVRYNYQTGKWELVPLEVIEFAAPMTAPRSTVAGIPRSYFPPNVPAEYVPRVPASSYTFENSTESRATVSSTQVKNDLTRATAFTILYQEKGTVPAYPGRNPFRDVKRTDSYFQTALQAYRDGYVGKGYFRPRDPISAEEIVALVRQMYGKTVSFPSGVNREILQRTVRGL